MIISFDEKSSAWGLLLMT